MKVNAAETNDDSAINGAQIKRSLDLTIRKTELADSLRRREADRTTREHREFASPLQGAG